MSITVQISVIVPHRVAYNILENNTKPIKVELSLTMEVQEIKGDLQVLIEVFTFAPFSSVQSQVRRTSVSEGKVRPQPEHVGE